MRQGAGVPSATSGIEPLSTSLMSEGGLSSSTTSCQRGPADMARRLAPATGAQVHHFLQLGNEMLHIEGFLFE